MQQIYQPVMLIELLKRNGTATVDQIAQAILNRDPTQIEYYSEIVKNMVGRVLTKSRGITEKHNNQYQLIDSQTLTQDQIVELIRLCDQKIGTERQACLRIQNEEPMHVKVEDIVIKVQNQQTTVVPTFLTVLPKSYKDINISIPRVSQPVTIEAKTTFGPASITLPVQFTQK
jgi:hypothetical protein